MKNAHASREEDSSGQKPRQGITKGAESSGRAHAVESLDQRIANKIAGQNNQNKPSSTDLYLTASSSSSSGSSRSIASSARFLQTTSFSPPPAEFSQVEKDILAKQQGKEDSTAELTPGAFSVRGHGNSPVPDRFESKIAAKVAKDDSTKGRATLTNLENSIANKILRDSGGPLNEDTDLGSDNSKAAALVNLEDRIASKIKADASASNPYVLPGVREELAGLEDSVAAKVARLDPQYMIANLDERVATKNAGAPSSTDVDKRSSANDTKLSAGSSAESAAKGAKGDDTYYFSDNHPDKSEHQDPEEMVPITGGNQSGSSLYEQGSQEQQDEFEFGVIPPDQRNLAVAVAVDEEEELGYIPSAVQYDPDAKPKSSRKHRYRLYAFCAFLVLVLVGVGATVGVVVGHGNNEPSAPTMSPTTYRESLGIRARIENIVGTERLADPFGPYALALDWIVNQDPMQVTPDQDTFLQRFIAAYFYFATSIENPWGSCDPPSDGEKEDCILEMGAVGNGTMYRWLTGENECSWAGISCDDNGQIRSIVLVAVNMTGSFPEGIQFLSYLQEFTAAVGQIEGTIPTKLGLLKRLVSIELPINKLTGTIPTELWSLPSLQRLNFGDNLLNGTIGTEIGQLTSCKAIYLYDNLLTGTIPTEIGLLTELYYLYLYVNGLKGTIPTEIGRLTGLNNIRLQYNELTGTIPTELGMLQMEVLRLNDNNLTGSLPTEILVPSLKDLYLFRNQFTGTLSTWIGNMEQGKRIRFDDNLLTGTVPSEIALLPDLMEFYLDGNQFNGSVPPSICQLRNSSFLKVLTADCARTNHSISVSSSTSSNTTTLMGGERLACSEDCCTICCYHPEASSFDNKQCFPTRPAVQR